MSRFVELSVSDDLLTVAEAAEISTMSKSWWRQRVFRKEIDFFTIGRSVRIKRKTVENLLDSSLVTARSRRQN